MNTPSTNADGRVHLPLRGGPLHGHTQLIRADENLITRRVASIGLPKSRAVEYSVRRDRAGTPIDAVYVPTTPTA